MRIGSKMIIPVLLHWVCADPWKLGGLSWRYRRPEAEAALLSGSHKVTGMLSVVCGSCWVDATSHLCSVTKCKVLTQIFYFTIRGWAREKAQRVKPRGPQTWRLECDAQNHVKSWMSCDYTHPELLQGWEGERGELPNSQLRTCKRSETREPLPQNKVESRNKPCKSS